MPKLAINFCIDVMDYLKNRGFEKEVPKVEVTKAIRIKCGEGVGQKYWKLMREFDLIKLHDKNPQIVILNYDKSYEYML